jgi:hypothetical protein
MTLDGVYCFAHIMFLKRREFNLCIQRISTERYSKHNDPFFGQIHIQVPKPASSESKRKRRKGAESAVRELLSILLVSIYIRIHTS